MYVAERTWYRFGELYPYGAWFLRYGAWWAEFFILNYFCTFTSLTTWKIKILKKWKPLGNIIFYTCVLYIKIIWCMVPEISSTTDRIFLSLWTFFALFFFFKTKKWKRPGDIVLHVCQKLWFDDKWFLRYGVQQTGRKSDI